jgi:hypothetical protein
MHRHILPFAVGLISSVAVIAQGRVPLKILADLGLSAQQSAAIDAGRLAKVLSWGAVRGLRVRRRAHRWGAGDIPSGGA